MGKYCRYCGRELSEHSAFCGGCGKAVQGQAVPGTEVRRSRFCRSCGQPLGQGARFCRVCGQRAEASARQRKTETSGQDGKRTVSARGFRFWKPVVAAGLAIAVFVSFAYPGFVRVRLSDTVLKQLASGRNRGEISYFSELSPEELEAEYAAIDAAYAAGELPREAAAEREEHAPYGWLYGEESGWGITAEEEEAGAVTVLPEGKSKAFRMKTPYGITLSAEKNALDRDRTFSVEPASAAQYDAVEAALPEAVGAPGLLLGLWELDAGMSDDELLPGHYTVEIELEKLGLEKEDFDGLRAYRIDSAGRWYEYSVGLNGDSVTIEANQNSILCTILVMSAPIYDTLLANGSGAYFNPFIPVNFDLKYEGKAVMEIMLDRSSVTGELASFNEERYAEMEKSAKEEAFNQIQEEEKALLEEYSDYSSMEKGFSEDWNGDPELQKAANRIKKKFVSRYEKLLLQKVEADPDYERIRKNLKEYREAPLNMPDLRPELEAVEKVCEAALRAWKWMKEDLGLRMPGYKFRIELSVDVKEDTYGATVPPVLSNPYMVISMKKVFRGDKLTYDCLLCTVCHELFHAVQRVYKSNATGNYKFDEMSAQDLEGMAYDHFKQAEENPITSPREEVLDNLEDVYWFALPLDDVKTSYPEGALVASDGKATVAYPIAPFLTYLREKKTQRYAWILLSYRGLWGHRAVSTILKKAFSLDEKGLTEFYHQFAESYQTKFYKAAYGYTDPVFSPLEELHIGSGKKEVELPNKKYTIRVRRVGLVGGKRSPEKYAMVLRYADNFGEKMSDFRITPLNMKKDEDYREYAGGVFFAPRAWSASRETIYLMEVDGGTAETTEGWLWDSNSGYTLYLMKKPEAPELARSGSALSVKLPVSDAWPGHEIVDAYVITLRSGKKELLKKELSKKEVTAEPVRIDISEIEKKLSQEERNNLVLIVQESVDDSIRSEEPCLGPESDAVPVPLSDEICGTWEIQSELQNNSSPMLDSYLGALGEAAGAAGGEFAGDINSYIEEYYRIQEEQSKTVSSGRMVLRPTEREGVMEAVFRFEGAPEQIYEGSYDRDRMELRLRPKNTLYTDSQGNQYDLAEYGLATELKLRFSGDGGTGTRNGAVNRFTGESAMDNQFASFQAVLQGTKLSDAY
ncbi:MAG: double zinc ribbon domain-containing protein [Stomatobaculum sp.]